MHWIERIINFVRDGLPEPLSLEVLLPHTGPERVAILAEVDSIVDYHHALKAAHHERMRRRLVRGEAREADEAQRRANRLGDNDVDGQGHAELDESFKRQNALEKKAEAFDMRAREQRAFDCSRWRRLTLARRHRRGAAAPHNAGLDG